MGALVKAGDRVRWVGDGPNGPIGTLRRVQSPDTEDGNHIWIVDMDDDPRPRSRKEFELEPARWGIHVHYADGTTGRHRSTYAKKSSAKRRAARLEATAGIKSAAIEEV